MNKIIYRFIGAVVAFALIFGSYGHSSAGASAVTNPQLIGQTGSSKLVFEDNFDGPALNQAWTNGNLWWNNGLTGAGIGEQQNYMNTQATVSSGNLNLVAINQPSGGRPYTSGLVTTGGIQGKSPIGFSFLYGYAEAKIKLPAGNGMWPAFWLWPSDYMDPPEIDILESLGREPNIYYATLHNPDNGRDVQTLYNSSVNLSENFHVYAVDWQADYLDFYFDGVRISHFNDINHYFSKPMYLILNLALGGSWAGAVDKARLPAVMSVDYVRVWKNAPTPTSVSPTTVSTILPTVLPPTVISTNALPTMTSMMLPTVLPPTVTSTNVLPTVTSNVSPTSLPATTTTAIALPTVTSTVFPTVLPPTVLSPQTVPSVPETIYEDNDNAFVYSSGWRDISNQKAYGGSYKLATKNSSFVTFNFTGQSFSILYKRDPTFRKINVYVDGFLVGTINEQGRSSFQKRWDYSGQLISGGHTLKLVFVTGRRTDDTSGSLDAVIVRQ